MYNPLHIKMDLQSVKGFMQQYTYEITPEIREAHARLPYDEELLSLCDNIIRKELKENNEKYLSRPLAHILRFADVGSRTRCGG